MRRLLLLTAALAGATLLPLPDRADACSLPPPMWFDEDPDAPITGIPTSGVVPFFARARPDEIPDGYPRATVIDPAGAELAGTVELTSGRLVWRADAPLAPNTTYRATVELSTSVREELTFVTAGDDQLPAIELAPTRVQLREIQLPRERICCDARTCDGTTHYEHCWRQSVDLLPKLDVDFALAPEVVRHYRITRDAPGAFRSSDTLDRKRAESLYAVWRTRMPRYCVTVRAEPFAGGDAVTREVCETDDALVPAPPFTPEEPDYDLCYEAPVDPDTNEEVDIPGGCTTGGTGAAWWIIAALAALARRRYDSANV